MKLIKILEGLEGYSDTKYVFTANKIHPSTLLQLLGVPLLK